VTESAPGEVGQSSADVDFGSISSDRTASQCPRDKPGDHEEIPEHDDSRTGQGPSSVPLLCARTHQE